MMLPIIYMNLLLFMFKSLTFTISYFDQFFRSRRQGAGAEATLKKKNLEEQIFSFNLFFVRNNRTKADCNHSFPLLLLE